MKRTIFTSIIVAGLLSNYANAMVWRVNNMGFNADFVQINAAVADPNVLNGDTLHVEGSTVAYTHAVITKQLVIIGAGYFLMDNPKTTNNGLASNSSYITFNAGSENSQLIGMSINDGGGVFINTNNITIRRNKIKEMIWLESGLSNINIVQNFFENSSSTSSVISTSGSGFPTNFRFNNNIVRRPLTLVDDPGFSILECNNNVFDLAVVPSSGHSLRFYTASFKNNILVNNTATVKINGITNFSTTANAAVTHNIGSSAAVHFGTANDNLVVTSMASIWNTAFAASQDRKYSIAPGSVASASGYMDVDRGAFGNLAASNRYTPSGVAPIPVIYEVSTSGVATPSTGLDIIIKARTVE